MQAADFTGSPYWLPSMAEALFIACSSTHAAASNTSTTPAAAEGSGSGSHYSYADGSADAAMAAMASLPAYTSSSTAFDADAKLSSALQNGHLYTTQPVVRLARSIQGCRRVFKLGSSGGSSQSAAYYSTTTGAGSSTSPGAGAQQAADATTTAGQDPQSQEVTGAISDGGTPLSIAMLEQLMGVAPSRLQLQSAALPGSSYNDGSFTYTYTGISADGTLIVNKTGSSLAAADASGEQGVAVVSLAPSSPASIAVLLVNSAGLRATGR